MICIGALDLEGVKGNADSQRGRLAKTGSGETRDLFSIPITKRKKNREKMAEGKGFEPPKGISSFNDLANRRLQPLGHPPAGVTGPADKFLASAHVHNTRRMLPFL